MDVTFNAPLQPESSGETSSARHNGRLRTNRDTFKGAMAGLIAGLIGTYFMSEYQGLWSKWVNGGEPNTPGGRHDARDWEEKNEGDNANQQAAQAVVHRTAGRELTDRELEIAAPLMHYAFGGAISAAYGIFAEHAPWTRGGAGAGYGTLVWLGADEIAMPLIGWSQPQRFPLESHVQSFTAHIVFGVTTEVTRRAVRRVLE